MEQHNKESVDLPVPMDTPAPAAQPLSQRMNLRNLSLRMQLMLAVVAGQALMMALLAVFLLGSQQRFLLNSSQQEAQGMARALAVGAVFGVMTQDVAGVQEVVSAVADSPDVAYALVMDLDGKVLAHSDRSKVGQFVTDVPSLSLLSSQVRPMTMHLSPQRTDVASPLLAQGRHFGWARVALHNSNVAEGSSASVRMALVFLVIASLLAVVVGLGLARHFTGGLHQLLQALERLRTGERGFRLDETRHDEVGHLGQHFNAMLADLERQEAETWRRAQELDVERTRLANIIEGTQAGTWEWNVQTGGVLFNRRWAEMLGYQLEELQPLTIHTWYGLLHPDDLELSNQRMARHFSGELPYYECQVRVRHRVGHWIWVLDRGQVATWSDDGRPLWMFGTHQDITEQKKVEVNLRQATELAEKAARAKGDFLANMSHEIRTPMNAVIGIAHLLERSPLNPDQRQLLGRLQVASRSLLGLIDDVLDLGKIEAGQMTLESVVFSPQVLLGELYDMFLAQAQAKHLHFELRGLQDLPHQLQGDVVRLRQILSNLVSNAIKFTQSGEVVVAVRSEADDAARMWLHASVKDTGCGIAPEVQARLFTPFTQADASTTRRFGGSGLGLSIVRRLVTLLGGEVGLTSSPGQGSEFWVRVPLALAMVDVPLPFVDELPAQGAQLPVPSDENEILERLPGVRLLLVDDSEINLDVASRLLRAEGASVRTCTNGREAVDCLRANPQQFDAVLMDIQMPEMDGFEATRLLRAEQGLAHLPVLAVTAGALVEERWRAMAAGMDGFLTKPLDPALLVSTLRQSVERVRGQAVPVRRRPVQEVSSAQEVASAGHWPVMDGVDVEDARRRLGGEWSLFITLLDHLMEEFGWMAEPNALLQAWQHDAKALIGRIHKLRGSSGMLGAISVHQRATQAELGLQSPEEIQQAGVLLTQLAQAIEFLGQTARPVLEAQRQSRQASPPASQRALAPAQRAQLGSVLSLLAAQDLAAIEQFRQAREAVLLLGGGALFEQVQQAIQLLDFPLAMQTLEHALSEVPPAVG